MWQKRGDRAERKWKKKGGRSRMGKGGGGEVDISVHPHPPYYSINLQFTSLNDSFIEKKKMVHVSLWCTRVILLFMQKYIRMNSSYLQDRCPRSSHLISKMLYLHGGAMH